MFVRIAWNGERSPQSHESDFTLFKCTRYDVKYGEDEDGPFASLLFTPGPEDCGGMVITLRGQMKMFVMNNEDQTIDRVFAPRK